MMMMMCGKPDTWSAFGASVIGASHIRKGLPNQDAFCVHTGSISDTHMTPAIVTVSDGHGGSKYIRSARGSQFAAEAMLELAKSMSRAVPQPEERLRISEVDMTAERIKMQFLSKWQAAADTHFEQHPLTDEEKAFLEENCSEKDIDSITENPRVIYGCTFLCVIAYKDMVLAMQYGDGDILGVYTDDEVRELIPADERNIANETLSLCRLTNPAEIKHEVYTGAELPILITLSTDGVKNSFDDLSGDTTSGFYKIPVDILSLLIKNGYNTEPVTDILKTELERITTYGAGDDVTLGVLFI